MMLTYDEYPLALQVIEAVSQGQPVTKACRAVGLNRTKFLRIVKSDRELGPLYEEAMELGGEALADALLDPFDRENPYNEIDPQKAKIISENIKWLLARRNRELYGDKVEIKQEVTVSFAITDELNKARLRAQLALPAPVDAEFEELTQEQTTEYELQEFMKQIA